MQAGFDSPAVGLGGPTMGVMSTSDAASEWDLTVPCDDAELSAEFRRHGIRHTQSSCQSFAPPPFGLFW